MFDTDARTSDVFEQVKPPLRALVYSTNIEAARNFGAEEESQRERDAVVAAKMIRTIRGLQHPGILRFIEEIQTAHNQIFVTECFEINPLGPLLRSGNYRHDELFTVRLVQQAAHVLTYLHGLRPPIVHGACTLENFLLSSEGRLVLTSFDRAHDDPRRAFETLDDIRRLAIGAIQLLTKLPPDEIAILMVEDLIKMSISRPLATLLTEALSPDPHT